MTDRNPRSLPPLVDGNTYGHLLVRIDEILWCNKYPSEVFVVLQWWGDVDSVTFRPADILKYPESARSDNCIKYNIQTNISLFETYLKQCNKLKLLVVNDDSKEIVGHVEINNLLDQITKIQLQKYFPIVTSLGKRIGDLRVDFDFSMNSSVSEETSKKTRKRSRKKSKLGNNTFRSVIEEEKSKQFKKGYKTCPNHINISKSSTKEKIVNFDMPESPKTNQAPPNTGRSDTSDYVLLDVLEKGKKLRDAMVLSVLEDSDVPVDVNEELLLKLDNAVEKGNKLTYQSSTKNGELVTPHEEKLISNYLEGKAMKEEEEKLVLTTLHPENRHENSDLKQHDLQNQENCSHSAKTSCRPSTFGHLATSTNDGNFMSLTGKSIGNLMKKINCFRLTVDSLTLTSAGWKKINQAIDNKHKSGDTVPPPGATYFVECHFVEDSPRSQAQSWKASPLRFCSRRQIEDVVYFGQSSAHPLKPPHSVGELEDVNCLVCWRHLHQRVPALLGTFRLAPLQGCLEMEDILPVISDNVTVVGQIKIKLQLGKDKLYFGNALLDEFPQDVQSEKIPTDKEQDKTYRSKETLKLNMKDLESKNASVVDGQNKEPYDTSTARNPKESCRIAHRRVQLPNCTDIPSCSNCGQNLILSNVGLQTPTDTSLCVSCSSLLGQHQSLLEPNFKISIPKNVIYKERRHHEFLIGIDTVKEFPLFANVQEELCCYVDYKFPQITSGLKAEMSRTETTSRMVAVETQPCLASVHRHSLTLPVVLPLSPLLAACSSGITLRLWLRYYKPTPRDHMVAMALLPMDELCLMELEFDERQQEVAITKVLELPLALVPSSVTSPYQKSPSSGTVRVSITYSNFIAPPPKLATNAGEQANEIHKTTTKEDEREQNSFTRELKPISVLLDRISATSEALREELPRMKNRFWTGPFSGNVEKNEKFLKAQEPAEEVCKNQTVSNIVTSNFSNNFDSARERDILGSSRPVMKEDLDLLAESIEHRFNRLQSDLLKEKQRGITEMSSSIVAGSKKLNSSLNGELDDDFLSFHSPLSSNSSMESLPFILGPPADFKDIQNTVARSKGEVFSQSTSDKSVSDTISGFFKEEKDDANYVSNDSIDKNEPKPENIKPKTFKAMIKIDRAVNLKAVKAPCNGKKGKVPPSSWVSFGIGDCCEQNCGTGGLVCAGPRFTTPVVRRNHNPIWNLSWDVDLPVEYLQKEEKRLVFSVFEEQLSVCVGRAATSVAILRSGLPCLSTWLSIDDSQGACRGQLKVVVTPLEDVRQYQNCSNFDVEEDYFEEPKERLDSNFVENENSPAFVASQTEVFVNQKDYTSEGEIAYEVNNQTDNAEAIEEEDPFLADDIISDYKNTLENNFRNEMAGLENLIKFLRVGSMSSDLSFFRSTENKENLSSNPSPQFYGGESRISAVLEPCNNVNLVKSTTINHTSNHNSQKDRCLMDATAESVDNCGITANQQNSEDVLSKLLHQISNFQPSVIKITDNTSQTFTPETKESSTETCNHSQLKSEAKKSVCMKDVSTATEGITEKPLTQDNSEDLPSRHVCEELGNVLLQHFLTCKPPPVKVADSTTQTDCQDGVSTVNSSGVFMSGISIDSARDLQEGHAMSDRLAVVDHNIKDLEQFLKQNIVPDRNNTSSESKGSSSMSSVNELMDFSCKDISRPSSDVESLESCSQITVQPRETPDGGNSSVVPDPQESNSDNMETSFRRRGTFVINKPTKNPDDPKENPSDDTI